MPRVDESHRQARRQQVLAATMRCVEREGFHKTTMAAVIRESGLSAGAVYLYFKGKQDLIRAIAETAVSGLTSTIHELADAEETLTPEEAIVVVCRRVLELGGELGVELPKVALQAWAEAARDPEIKQLVATEARGTVRAGSPTHGARSRRATFPRTPIPPPRQRR